MKFVVGIVTRGRAELAEKAVASALAQVPPPELVWVIEDGVVGKPFEWKGGGLVRITRWSEPKGFMTGRHQMMMEADAEVYVSLDDDAWFLDPQAVADAMRALKEDCKVAAVAFDILSPDRPSKTEKKQPFEVPAYVGCGHALRLQAVREAGGYQKMPGSYGGEERDLCLRLQENGWKVIKMPGVHVWHDLTPKLRNLNEQQRSSVTNDLFLIWMRAPLIILIPCLVGTFCNHLKFAIQREFPLGPRFLGLLDFLKRWPSLIFKRKAVSRSVWKQRHQISD